MRSGPISLLPQAAALLCGAVLAARGPAAGADAPAGGPSGALLEIARHEIQEADHRVPPGGLEPCLRLVAGLAEEKRRPIEEAVLLGIGRLAPETRRGALLLWLEGVRPGSEIGNRPELTEWLFDGWDSTGAEERRRVLRASASVPSRKAFESVLPVVADEPGTPNAGIAIDTVLRFLALNESGPFLEDGAWGRAGSVLFGDFPDRIAGVTAGSAHPPLRFDRLLAAARGRLDAPDPHARWLAAWLALELDVRAAERPGAPDRRAAVASLVLEKLAPDADRPFLCYAARRYSIARVLSSSQVAAHLPIFLDDPDVDPETLADIGQLGSRDGPVREALRTMPPRGEGWILAGLSARIPEAEAAAAGILRDPVRGRAVGFLERFSARRDAAPGPPSLPASFLPGLKAILEDPDVGDAPRAQALLALARVGTPAATAEVESFVRDLVWPAELRWSAALALADASPGDPGARRARLVRLVRDDPMLRFYATLLPWDDSPAEAAARRSLEEANRRDLGRR